MARLGVAQTMSQFKTDQLTDYTNYPIVENDQSYKLTVPIMQTDQSSCGSDAS